VRLEVDRGREDFRGIKCTNLATCSNNVGMKPHLSRPEFTPQETQLIQQLRQQPEMLARVQGILDLARAAGGPLKTADEVEALLIQALRQLGRTTMQQWATQAEARVSTELQAQDATVRGLKKKR
jgi:hypothetical protein